MNMEDNILTDAIERYFRGEMSAEERTYFEDLRKNTPDIDLMVVEHTMFLQQMEAYGQNRKFKHELHEVHSNLLEAGSINEGKVSSGKVISLWNRYKRITAIAASIAGVTALFISGLVSYYTPVQNKNQIQELDRKLRQINHKLNVQGSQISDLKKSKVPFDAVAGNGGTSFMIDSKGYLVTNAHVVRGASTILVENSKGQEFKSKLVHLDEEKDIAILKIDDEDYKPIGTLPYSIRKANTDLGAQIFTLGFPKDEIVYNEGYLSSENGHNGDTLSVQINVSANPGNSGGPVLNKNGEVIGILSATETQAEGVVFAIKSKNIFQALEELRKDTAYQRIRLPTSTFLRGIDREQQIKQIQDCVFMVRSFTR